MKTQIKMKCFILVLGLLLTQMTPPQALAQSKKKIVSVSFTRAPSSPAPKKKIKPSVLAGKKGDQSKVIITDTPYGMSTPDSDLEPIRITAENKSNRDISKNISKTAGGKKLDRSFYEPIDDSKFDQ